MPKQAVQTPVAPRIKGVELEPIRMRAANGAIESLVRIHIIDALDRRVTYDTTPAHALNVSSQLGVVAVHAQRQAEVTSTSDELLSAPRIGDIE